MLPIEVASKIPEFFQLSENLNLYHLALTCRQFSSFTQPHLVAARLYAGARLSRIKGFLYRPPPDKALECLDQVLHTLLDPGCQVGMGHKVAILSGMVWNIFDVPQNKVQEIFLKAVDAVPQVSSDEVGSLLLDLHHASLILKPADQPEVHRRIDGASHALSRRWALACQARRVAWRRDGPDSLDEFESILREMATLPPAEQAQVLLAALDGNRGYRPKLQGLLLEHGLETAALPPPEERGPMLVVLAKYGKYFHDWERAFHTMLKLCAGMPAAQKSVALSALAAALRTKRRNAESTFIFHALLDESATLPAGYRQWLVPKLMAGARGYVDHGAITQACGKLLAQMRSPALPPGAKAKLLAGLLRSFPFLPDNDDASSTIILKGMAEIASQEDDAKAALLSDVARVLKEWTSDSCCIRNCRNALALGALRLSTALPDALLAPLLQGLFKFLAPPRTNLDGPLPTSMRELENFNTLVAAVARLPDTARQPMLERLNDLARHLPGDALREAAR
ncbi:MAG: hypothetical protein ACO1N5_03450, partial [Noviherbaspirillum sp.]